MKKLITGCTLAALCFCGTITETDSGISGRVRYSNGSSAGNIGVKLFRDTATTQLSYGTTSGDGSYSFGKLEPGFYNVWAEDKDSVAAFRDSIYVQEEKKSTADLTLEKGGSVTAVVRLQPGHDPRSASAQALGTEKYSNVDSAGRFTIKNLAPNEYTLRVATVIAGYAPAYLTVAVTSGVADTLKDTIVLPYFDIPHVTGIRAHYDSTTGVATVSWNKTGYATFYQYRVYRDPVDAIVPSKNPVAARVDTVFYDTLYVKKPGAPPRKNAVPDKQLRYRVTIVNKSMNEGEPYEFADVAAEDPYRVTKLLTPAEGARFTDSAGITVVWNSAGAKRRYQIQVDTAIADTIEPVFSNPIFDSVVSDTAIRLPTLFIGRFCVRIRVQYLIGDWGWGAWSDLRKFAVTGGLFAEELSCIGSDFIKTRDNGYAVIGIEDQNNKQHPNLVKTDSIGIEKWRWTSASEEIESMNTLIQLKSGDYFIAGRKKNNERYRVFMATITENGSLRWSKTIDNDSESVIYIDAIETPDQGILAMLNRSASNSFPPSTGTYHLVKITGSGTILWDTTVNPIFTKCVRMLPLDEENFLVINISGPGIGSPDSTTDSICLKKIDFSCTVREEIRFGWPTCRWYSRFALGKDGGLYIYCNINWNLQIFKTTQYGKVLFKSKHSGNYACPPCFSPTADNGLIVSDGMRLDKYDSKGSISWSREKNSTRLAISEENDGSFSALTITRDPVDPYGTNEWLVKLSKNGVSFEE